MIFGIGIDIVDIERIRKLLERSRSSFLERAFTAQEQAQAKQKHDEAVFFASRWAAKEAAAKALGCGIGAKAALVDLEITNNSQGTPILTLHGAAQAYALECGIKECHISISHEKNYAIANVILEK